MSENPGSTQPNIPIKKKSTRGRTFLLSALGLILILGLAILAGYGSGISVRKNTQTSVLAKELGEQFQYALVDIEFGRYDNARQRLEYIIKYDPTFPGVQEKLTQVLVLSNAPTPTAVPSLTPTPDFTGAEQAFAQAQQLIAAQDWPAALGALDQIRKLDPNYKTSLVDGMYYFALRNHGYNLITKQGNLEGGIYHFTLAERFGPLDRDAYGLREGARYYLIGASFWELDWQQALAYFSQVAGYGLWDGTYTVGQRIHIASMRYGDQLLEEERWCEALPQYEAAQAIGALDEAAAEGYARAYAECYPATATIDPASLFTPTVPTAVIPVETTVVAPPPAEATATETPTATPTNTLETPAGGEPPPPAGG